VSSEGFKVGSSARTDVRFSSVERDLRNEVRMPNHSAAMLPERREGLTLLDDQVLKVDGSE
jgi:hypothetical protein